MKQSVDDFFEPMRKYLQNTEFTIFTDQAEIIVIIINLFLILRMEISRIPPLWVTILLLLNLNCKFTKFTCKEIPKN